MSGLSGDEQERVAGLMRAAGVLGDLRRLGVPEDVLAPLREWLKAEALALGSDLVTIAAIERGDYAKGAAARAYLRQLRSTHPSAAVLKAIEQAQADLDAAEDSP